MHNDDAQRTRHRVRHTPQPPADTYLTMLEAAEYIGVDKSTLWRWLKTNPKVIPHHRTVGGHRRFKTTDLDHFIRSSE